MAKQVHCFLEKIVVEVFVDVEQKAQMNHFSVNCEGYGQLLLERKDVLSAAFGLFDWKSQAAILESIEGEDEQVAAPLGYQGPVDSAEADLH
jgi:hypothetical protein